MPPITLLPLEWWSALRVSKLQNHNDILYFELCTLYPFQNLRAFKTKFDNLRKPTKRRIMQTHRYTPRLEDYSQWRYDHILSEDEERYEAQFNKEMMTSVYRENPNAKYNDVYWLLTEWRKNTAILLELRNIGDKHTYDIMLSHRMMLNYYLTVYLQRTKGKQTQVREDNPHTSQHSIPRTHSMRKL